MDSSTTEGRPRRPFTAQGLIGVLALFAGLCTIFVLIVTVADSWSEHKQERWQQATASIERCSVEPFIPYRSKSRDPVWYIQCRIGYRADADQIETSVRSRTTGSLWGGVLPEMRQWVDHHPPGSPMVVHYDPVLPRHAVLTETDMPYAGPRTPDNLKLLAISAVAFVGLVMVARRLGSQAKMK